MSEARPGFDPMLFAKYASLKEPEKVLPSSIYRYHTSRTLTIWEEYPKSKIHNIMIPRAGAPPRVRENLKDLYTLLTSPEVSKSEAEALLREMREDAEAQKVLLEEEMIYSFGFKGDFWMGFKVQPSYKYLHMHIMSDDLAADDFKYPRHFFSFHPYHGEFIHIDEVLSWFEIVDERYKDNIDNMRRKRLQLLKNRDSPRNEYSERRVYDCYRRDGGIECCFEAKTFPIMKRHLEEHYKKNREVGQERIQARQAFERQQAIRAARLAEERRREAEGNDETQSESQPKAVPEGDEVQGGD